MSKETFLPIGVAIVTLQRKLWEYQVRIVMPCSYFSSFTVCWLAFRGSPAETRLTVYCWLLIPAQPIGTGNLSYNWWACFCAQTLIARDPVVTFERRLKVTKTYGQRNFLAYRRCHCYTTEKVMGVPDQNCDVTCVHKLRSCIKQMQSFMSGRFLFFSSEMGTPCSHFSSSGWVGLLSGVPQQKLGWQFTAGC
jgi:hypothetical protein